jgi:radical SAM protein with 4Fe4S-binding SPASM domain
MVKQLINSMFKPMAFRHMMSIVNERPIDLNIETTNYCPSKCVFCPNSKSRRTKRLMDMDLFEKICADYYNIGGGAVGICSMQADIFSDDLLLERLKVLNKYRDKFKIYTVTMLAGASKLSDMEIINMFKLFSAIDISLGGWSKESYKSLYGIDAFDTVIGQLFRLAELKKKNRLSTQLGLQFRTNEIVKTTQSQLFAQLEESYTVKEILSNFSSWGGFIEQSDLPPGATLITSENTCCSVDCVVPWSVFSVNTDGLVTGCGCVDWEMKHPIGNMRYQGIKEIWNSIAAKQFRSSFSNKNIPEICRSCAVYTDIEHAFGRLVLVAYKPMYGNYYDVKMFPGKLKVKIN